MFCVCGTMHLCNYKGTILVFLLVLPGVVTLSQSAMDPTEWYDHTSRTLNAQDDLFSVDSSRGQLCLHSGMLHRLRDLDCKVLCPLPLFPAQQKVDLELLHDIVYGVHTNLINHFVAMDLKSKESINKLLQGRLYWARLTIRISTPLASTMRGKVDHSSVSNKHNAW